MCAITTKRILDWRPVRMIRHNDVYSYASRGQCGAILTECDGHDGENEGDNDDEDHKDDDTHRGNVLWQCR